LARFVRPRPNFSADLSVATATWESDLQYLKETYYEGKFDFPWPDTTIRAPDEPAQSSGTADLIKTNHDVTGVSEENGLG
jgi:hypothetical protein